MRNQEYLYRGVSNLTGRPAGPRRAPRAAGSCTLARDGAISTSKANWEDNFGKVLRPPRVGLSDSAPERKLRGRGRSHGDTFCAGFCVADKETGAFASQAWLANVLRRIADHPAARLYELLRGIGNCPRREAAAA